MICAELPPRSPAADVAWLTWGNDCFGVPGRLQDDHRTNDFSGGIRRGPWVVCLGDSMLTLLDPAEANGVRHGARIDEATAMLGREVSPTLTLGVGVRYRGDLGGENIQDRWHAALGDNPVYATYDDSSAALLGYASWRRVFHPEAFFAPELLASAVAGSDAEFAADAAARLVWYTVSDVTVWAGLRYRAREGGSGVVAGATADFERGLCYEFGFSLARAFSFQSTYSLATQSATGAFTYVGVIP